MALPPHHDDPAVTRSGPPTPSDQHGRFLPGTVLADRYRIVALAGQGGMGEVYRADDLKIGQPVALKFLATGLERDPDRLQRLLGEVRVARQVSHPNVCRVHDIVEFAGHHFITMEYVDGEDLATLLRRIGRLPHEKALDMSRQIAAGLAAAHVQGIVHRDLKPANIMLDRRGRARITDFGLAAAAEAVRGREAQWGTPAYMAPEQTSGGDITPRTDVYALGLVLFEIFTGRRTRQDSARPSGLIPGLDPKIDAAILHCIENDPARRPASAAAVLAILPAIDPLEAALRVGETPSPEVVAAAGDEGSLTPAKAWGLVGLAILAVAAAITVGARVTGLNALPMPRSPDALKERAQEIIQMLGSDVSPRAVEWWFDLDEDYAESSLSRTSGATLATARPSAVRFNYRQSPQPIVPTLVDRPSKVDPAPFWSGESYLALDPQGRLLDFARLDRQLVPEAVGASTVDWEPLLALTGTEVRSLRMVDPVWTPDVPSDTRAAWVTDDAAGPIRVEAAASRGKPVWLRTVAPWERAERDTRVEPIGYGGFVFFVVFLVTFLVAFGVLARHNLRLGRSDRRGAFRVGAAVFTCFGLAYALQFRWSVDPVSVLAWIARQPYLPGLMAWLYYLAIEPFLRRRWPHRLIAWTRLLDGRLTDPLVGREVLLGMLIGTVIFLLSCIPSTLEKGHEVTTFLTTLPLGRAADFWGQAAMSFGEGLMRALGSFAALLLFRLVFRRDAIAWAGLFVLMLFIVFPPPGDASVIQWITVVITASLALLPVRIGVASAVAANTAFALLTLCTPLTVDSSRWYAWRTGVIALFLVGIALWGFRSAMGRRRLLPDAALEG